MLHFGSFSSVLALRLFCYISWQFLALILACCTFVCFCSHFPWASIWGFTFQELFCAFSLHYFSSSKASRISWTLPLKTKRKTECILFSLFFFILKDMLNMDAFARKLVPPSQNGPYWPFRVFLTSSQSGRQKRFKTKQVNKKSIESDTETIKASRIPELRTTPSSLGDTGALAGLSPGLHWSKHRGCNVFSFSISAHCNQ